MSTKVSKSPFDFRKVPPSKDKSFSEFKIERVERFTDSEGVPHFTLHTTGGSINFSAESLREPRAGETVKFYGKGAGFGVRGIVYGEEKERCVAYYYTATQYKEKNELENEQREKEREEKFEREVSQLDSLYASLPTVFRRRIDKFRTTNPRFRIDFEGYEMSCCIDAVRLAERLKTTEKLASFGKMKWEEQIKLVPGLFEGHSGNSFGMAMRLAYHYLTNPANVIREHGALTALVGCAQYGCPHPKKEG